MKILTKNYLDEASQNSHNVPEYSLPVPALNQSCADRAHSELNPQKPDTKFDSDVRWKNQQWKSERARDHWMANLDVDAMSMWLFAGTSKL